MHLVFGFTIGLAFYKLSEAVTGEKKWSLTLVFIFGLNNYFGPDFGNILKKIARSIGSDLLFKLGASIHTYLGWVIFSIFWAPVWYILLKSIEKSRTNQKVTNSGFESREVTHSYTDVQFAVLAGGIFHHFEDLVGHRDEVGSEFMVRGRIGLWSIVDWDLIIMYICIIILVVIIIMIYIHRNKIKRDSVVDKINEYFLSKDSKKVIFFLLIGILNAFIMYTITSSYGLFDSKLDEFAWSNDSVRTIYFSWGDAMEATWLYNNDFIYWSSDYYYIICMVVLIIGFLVCNYKGIVLKFKGKEIRGEIIAIIAFILLVVTGYLLQPLIGNLSHKEYDFGALIGLWSTLGYCLYTLSMIKGKKRETTLN